MLIGFIVFATALLIRASRRRRSNRIGHLRLDAVIETVDFLLAMLRAGYSPPQSLMKLADITPHIVRKDFVDLRDAIASGRPIHEALTDVRTRLGKDADAIDEAITKHDVLAGVDEELQKLEQRRRWRVVRHRQDRKSVV